ncbi:tetratricopeptide repeat protein 14 homolog isoform X1 [Diorhabda sublineata]|uniref:tetratricopeptide repeat protein 14 homolog isoform X1 n=1 Tax=Diorhabda sublineata TaxID=1163346 RepID=UPI0024E12DF8|nr:tetratricopeptide repeat protein 14 homolog isoform X1 [Diorhabda sublineata]
METVNTQLISKAINFHGQQLQKLWEGEFGENDLTRRNIKDLNYNVYAQRQKNLSFQDRGKRLKLQQFLVKKGNLIYSLDATQLKPTKTVTEDMYAIMPPFETYTSVDKQKRVQFFMQNVKVGDLILGAIVSKQQSGMMLKVLCTAGTSAILYAADINIKAFCPVANVIPAVDKKGVARSYMMNDYVCCEVLEIIADTDKVVCGMKGVTRKPTDPEHQPALGLISNDDFPIVYKKASDYKNESYDSVLEKSIGFNNPNNIQYLSEIMGTDKHLSFLSGLKYKFPDNEYAGELRQVQASKWAYRNVADGIDHFKAGNHVEAFQCLNKALNIDPKNVEGLVARGALYANSGNFQKAIEDFETALKLNQSHANARKYMGETLVALGRSYEEENKIEEARKAYQSCLGIIPYHEEAQNSLEFLKSKTQPKNLIEPAELLLPALNVSSKTTDVNDALKQLLKNDEDEKKEKKKKKKSKKRKNRKRSSSSSSSSSSGSGESSSSSSSSSSDSSSSSGDSDCKKKKKHRSRSHRRKERENSLSPLSKRMALMDQSHETPNAGYNFNKPAVNTTFEFSFEKSEQAKPVENDYESKVRTFLAETKGDSDYEDKVRKFLEESAKWKKGKTDDKKKKKKKDKKAKKESKKKLKKEKKKRKQSFDLSELDEAKKWRDALKKELNKEKKNKRHTIPSDEEEYFLQKSGYSKKFIDSLPDLEELESKLNAYYALEKENKRGKERSESPEKRIIDSPSPTREQKARQAVAEAAASAGAQKWKMQIGPGTSGNSRLKKKPERQPPPAPPDWQLEREREKRGKSSSAAEDSPPQKKLSSLPPLPPAEKAVSVRKAMALKEPPPKKPESPKKLKLTPAPPLPKIPQGQVVLDKFGNFRLMTPPKAEPSISRRPPEPPGRPRSDSRSPKRRSRSRSKYSRSSSGSRSRSRSYRSRSRSYYSRSRSRSGSYYSRSRSRSRSYSGDRRRYNRRGGFRGRHLNDRGTYYKPRFQTPRHNGQRGRGGNYYNNRDSRYLDRDYRGRGRPYSYQNRGNRRQQRGRYGQRGGYRDYRDRDRRYSRSRSRDRDRSRSYSGSGSDTSPPPAKRDKSSPPPDKEKINKYSDGDAPVRHEGPLSEGEDRDDYISTDTNKLIDREMGGKWADKDTENSAVEEVKEEALNESGEVKDD